MNPEYLLADSTKPIRITKYDGTIIKMSPGNYKVIKITDSLFVSGKGKSIINQKKYKEEKYEGIINIVNIKQLEIEETYIPVILYPIAFIVGVSFIAMLYLAISLDGRGFGG